MAQADGQTKDMGIAQLVTELREMVVAYFRQEALDPFKGLGRFLAWGVGGGLLTAGGLVVLLVAVLRLLQTETGSTFTGHMSALPYAITLVTGLLLAGLATRAILAGRKAG